MDSFGLFGGLQTSALSAFGLPRKVMNFTSDSSEATFSHALSDVKFALIYFGLNGARTYNVSGITYVGEKAICMYGSMGASSDNSATPYCISMTISFTTSQLIVYCSNSDEYTFYCTALFY